MTAQNAPSPLPRSALFVAAGRAIGAREPDAQVRNPDYLAEQFLGDPSKLNQEVPTVRALRVAYDEAMQNLTIVNCVRMMIVRTRVIDDALRRAVADGAKQIVILGAGLDSYSYRCLESVGEVRAFEVDRPIMQAFKRQRVVAALGSEPACVTYVKIDFQRDELQETLIQHGYNPAQQTFFVMEGVSMHVAKEAVDEILRLVGRNRCGNGIVLDFLFGSGAHAEKSFILPRGREYDFFRERGLHLQTLLAVNGEEAARLYLTRIDGTQVGGQVIEETMRRMADDPATTPAQSMWGGTVWQNQGPLRYHIAEAVVL